MPMLDRTIFIIALMLICLIGCGADVDRAPAIEDAYVGPLSLELLAELSPEAAITGIIEHGEHVEIIERRRRFARIRTTRGMEGWTDGRMLLSPEQMAQLRRLSMHAAQLPSQGKATVYDALNVHTTPNRQAPSFYQITEGVLVEVVSHRIQPRRPYEPRANYSEILPRPSYGVSPDAPPPPGGADDWALVRIPDGRAGWALMRMLVMAIPDEVAQYAEGNSITSYFSLGEVNDGGDTKHHWLWTTVSSRLKPYEFDSFRVFVWNLRRHRYETAYIERNLVGYYPVEVAPADHGSGGQPAKSRISLVVRGDGGLLFRRTYAFTGYRVKMAEESQWIAPEQEQPPLPQQQPPVEEEEAIIQRIRRKFNELVGGS